MGLVEIAENAEYCRLLIRHTLYTGDSLTHAGVELAEKAALAYCQLFGELATTFDSPTCCCSPLIRAALSGQVIFGLDQIPFDLRLACGITLGAIPDNWFETQRTGGKTVPEMVRMVAENLSLVEGQAYEQRMGTMRSFFFPQGADRNHKLVVGMGHEPEPGLLIAQKELLPINEVGLDECHAYVVFSNTTGIIKVVKFNPFDHLDN